MFMIESNVEAHEEPCQTSMLEFFLYIVDVQKLLTILRKKKQHHHRCLTGSATSSTKFNKNSKDF